MVANLLTISCAGGCGKTQSVRRSRVRPADYYVCGAFRCEPPQASRPDGVIRCIDFYAAGGFTGITVRIATAEEWGRVEHARWLRDAAAEIVSRNVES